MVDLLGRLAAALADRYQLERELGRGGMATVYAATDRKHHRQVAIKVLAPELAHALGPERFLREIEVAAGLHHPHLLPVYDSGDADGLLYYVMPCVEGESLRRRLDRDQQLPVAEAVAIAREVADALSYAHSRNVVHRDIKPENILLESGHALVADFGIARAIASVEGDALTATGLALGTPAYMSPEQAAGDQSLDGRCDVYGLGCVLYEMLAGEPPHTGATAHAIFAKRLSEPAPSLRAVRETVPDALDRAISRSLARVPADRFSTAAEFGDVLGAALAGPAVPPRGPPRRRAVLIGGGMTAVLAIALAGYQLVKGGSASRDAATPPFDTAPAIAVLPFRVVGPDLVFWREGIMDMLSFNLEGLGGLRKIDPATVMTAWNRAGDPDRDAGGQPGIDVARQLGARYVVTGSAVEWRGGVVLTVDVHEVPGSALRGSARVTAPADSVLLLVDQLTVEMVRNGLIPADADLPAMSLSRVTTTSVPALKTYLAGERLYRRGRFREAVSEFRRAVELDSTFARAMVRLAGSYAWSNDAALAQQTWARATRFAERLPERDALLVRAPTGPQAIPYLEAFTRRYPDDAEGWTLLGDQYFHQGGASLQPADAFRLALGRAVDLFPHYSEAYIHLIEDAFARLDRARAGDLIAAYARIDPSRPCPDSYFYDLTWGDDASRTRALAGLDALSEAAEPDCVQAPLPLPAAAADLLEHKRLALLRPAVPEIDRFVSLFRMLQARVPRGQIAAARRLLGQAEALPVTRIDAAGFQVMLHLSGFPDTLAARRAAELLRTEPHPLNLFWLGALAAGSGRWDEVERIGRALEAAESAVDRTWMRSAEDATAAELAGGFARALRAYAALRRGEDRAAELEAALLDLPAAGWKVEHPGDFIRYDAGRLLFERGNPRMAERYFRSFYHYNYPYLTQAQFYLGRIYEALGQPERALHHYDLFTTWWRDCDPELRAWWQEGRDAQLRLTRSRDAG